MKIHKLNTLKSNARKYYIKNGFNPEKIGESVNFSFDSEYIINRLIKELDDIENNKSFKVLPVDNNIFDIDILYDKFSNSKITEELKSNKIDGILMNIKINTNLYPFILLKLALRVLI